MRERISPKVWPYIKGAAKKHTWPHGDQYLCMFCACLRGFPQQPRSCLLTLTHLQVNTGPNKV